MNEVAQSLPQESVEVCLKTKNFPKVDLVLLLCSAYIQHLGTLFKLATACVDKLAFQGRRNQNLPFLETLCSQGGSELIILHP